MSLHLNLDYSFTPGCIFYPVSELFELRLYLSGCQLSCFLDQWKHTCTTSAEVKENKRTDQNTVIFTSILGEWILTHFFSFWRLPSTTQFPAPSATFWLILYWSHGKMLLYRAWGGDIQKIIKLNLSGSQSLN